MTLPARIHALWKRRRPKPLDEWFCVTFDDRVVRMRVEPPGREPWDAEFTWASVVRVCFLAEDLYASDGIYVFTTQRPESYVIPTEAHGGLELWNEIIRRKLFDASLAIDAATAEGRLFCWPPPDDKNAPPPSVQR